MLALFVRLLAAKESVIRVNCNDTMYSHGVLAASSDYCTAVCVCCLGSIASEESVRITPSLRSKKGYAPFLTVF